MGSIPIPRITRQGISLYSVSSSVAVRDCHHNRPILFGHDLEIAEKMDRSFNTIHKLNSCLSVQNRLPDEFWGYTSTGCQIPAPSPR
jgi:hypothetical protein